VAESVGSGAAAPVPRPANRRLQLWIGLALVIVCAGYATHLRLAQLAAWKSNPKQYMASGVPMMTTLDAYYLLHIAREYAAGTWVPHGPAPARHYSRPEQADPNAWYDQREPKNLPLVSAALVALSRLFGASIDRVGLLLPALLASLFMIPLFLCCWRLDAPAAGLMGALVGTFCIEYYQRTSLGWLDTDPLNLFFPWTVAFLFLGMHGAQSRRRLFLACAGAGLVLYLFFLWYEKPGLTLAFAGALAVHLLLAGAPWPRSLLCIAILLVFANPFQFGGVLGNLEDFGRRYLWPMATRMPDAGSGIRFPEVWSTISEVQRLRWTDSLAHILPSATMAAVGLAGLALFAYHRWRRMAPLVPMLALGMLAFVSSRRFIIYLAPFVGIGWGHIVDLTTERVLGRLTIFRGPGLRTVAAYLAVIGVFFGWLATPSSRGFVPRPAIPASVFHDLQTLAQRLPANSRIWTWWDLGFAIVDATGLGVYHDGAAQYTPQTNLIAASFVDPSQRVMHDVICFVDREGNRGIRRLAAHAADENHLLLGMRDGGCTPAGVPIFVLFTPDMMVGYPAMRTLGTLDAAAARPRSLGIRWLRCERLVDDVLHCGGDALDLRNGLIERRARPAELARLRRAIVVEGGRVARERDYAGAAGLTVEIVMGKEAVRAVYLLDEAAFQSNLNQMYFLGRFDPARFEEAFNDFPYARAFRVLPTPD